MKAETCHRSKMHTEKHFNIVKGYEVEIEKGWF